MLNNTYKLKQTIFIYHTRLIRDFTLLYAMPISIIFRRGTSHQVVEQEFENVITILGPHFYYDENCTLKARKIAYNPYSPLKMFFQQITRAINKLEIVVVKNIELYNRIMQIFE